MILGYRLFDELDVENICCIGGNLSAGKTRLAFDIARFYWLQDYRVVANVPHHYFGRPKALRTHDLYKTVCIMDEGGEFVRDAKTSSLITRSAGKANYRVIFAGKRAPHKDLQRLMIEPKFNFLGVFGLPFIWWRVKVQAEQNYEVAFWQLFPHLVHGTYSTKSSGGAIESIISLAHKTVERLAHEEGQEAGRQVEAGLLGLADDLASTLS
jgi:hypothetical protein